MPKETSTRSRLRISTTTMLAACLLTTAWAAGAAASDLGEQAQETLVRLALEGTEASVPELERLRDAARAAEDRRAEGMVLWGLAAARIQEGHYGRAEELAKKSGTIWEALEEPDWVKRAGFQADIAQAMVDEPRVRAAAARAAFATDVSLLEFGQGRTGNALRLVERAILALEDVDDPAARQLSGPLTLARETIHRSLGLPVDSSGALARVRGTLLGSEKEIDLLLGTFELLELGERGAPGDRVVRHLAELIRDDPELADHEAAETIGLFEASQRDGLPAWLAYCRGTAENEAGDRSPVAGKNEVGESICSYLDLLRPSLASGRVELRTVQNVLAWMIERVANDPTRLREMSWEVMLTLENALGEPTAPEDWPSTEELAALLEAAGRRYADVPPELRTGVDGALSVLTQVAVRLRVRAGDPAGAFKLAERARARAFLDRLTAERFEPADAGARDEIAALRRRRDELGRRLVELAETDPAGPEASRLVEEHASVLSEIDTTFQRLALDAPIAERASLASLEYVRDALDEDTTLVAFMDFPEQPERPLAWVVDPQGEGGLRSYVLPTGYLESRISLLAQRLRNRDDDPRTAEELHQALWAPLAEHIDTRRVVLVPHGVFQDVPFAALRDAETGHRLIQDHTLLYAPSASAWVHLVTKPASRGRNTLILGDSRGDLPGSAEEARSIGAIWSSPPLVGEGASERAFREKAPGAGLIHLSGHGRTVADSDFTHLRLAPSTDPPTDPRNDGRLELHEIAEELDLGRTEIAVLPACRTGAGPRTRGDEVASLARAFLLAGARSVVTSGWAVDDRATAALMVDFHRHLAAGVEAAEALRRAQVAAIGSADRSNPWYWAAFSLHGAGGPVIAAETRHPPAPGKIVVSDRTLSALEGVANADPADARTIEEALRAARTEGDPVSEAALLWGLSQVAIEESRFDDALDLAGRGRAAWERLGDDEWTRRLAGWETLATALAEGQEIASPVLRALFLAEMIQVEMNELRIAEALRQSERALSLIDGLDHETLAFRLRLYRAGARAMLEPSETTLAELSDLMGDAARVLEAQRPEGRPDVTPLIAALPELMLAIGSGNFMAGLGVLEELAEDHGDLLSLELRDTIDMLGHLESQDTAAATEWCRRMQESQAFVDAPPGANLGFLCSLADFLAAADEETVDFAALEELFRSTGVNIETLEGPLREPVQSLNRFAADFARAIESGGEMPSTDDLVAALGMVERLGGSVPVTRRSGPDQSLLAPFGHVAARMSAEAGRIEESFELADRARARELLDLLATSRIAGDGDEQIGRAIAELRRRADDLEARLFDLAASDPTAPEAAALREEISTARLEIDRRFEQLALRDPETFRAATVPLGEIQGALGDDTTLVMYQVFAWPGNEALAEDPFAWIVDREGIEMVELDVDSNVLAHEIQLFVRKLRDRTDADELAESLYSHVWLPLREHIGTRRVVVVPHGALLDLPFAALRGPDGGNELVRQTTLLYAPSASAWARLRDRVLGNGDRVVMGNPTRDLDAAESEARTIAALWETPALTGTVASERGFRDLATGASLVHVASHGVLAPTDPSFSYLRLAATADAGSDPRADGRLELHEMIGGLDLSGTGLVVLSACRAGAGPTTGGGEMASLARGLLVAGARSAVTAAWDVDDRATAALMVDFHRGLAAGADATEALRSAQEAALASTDRRHPWYWAGFAVHGADGAVVRPEDP